jgi:hypothetical protein
MSRPVTDPHPRWHALAAALLAVAVLVGIFLLGHLTAGGTRTRTVTVNAGPGPGPARIVNGIPVGYTHNEAGAIAFATNWVAANGSLQMVNVAQRREFEELTMVPAMGAVWERQLHAIFSGGVVAGAVTLAAPLGYQVVSFTPNAARIAVWFVSTGGNARTLGSDFETATLWSTWQGGDWRLTAFGVADGPVLPPPRDESPSARGYLVSQIAQVGRLRYAP